MPQQTSRAWTLASRPAGMVANSNFSWTEQPVPQPQPGEVVVRSIYLSMDPTNRGWMNAGGTYLPGVELGDVMRGLAIGVVEQSRDDRFAEGDLVGGMLGWRDMAVVPGSTLHKLHRHDGLPITAHLGLLGHIGLTAYYGLLEIGTPKQGETLVVSGAAGAVGSLVCQIGRIEGMRVVGIAGGEEKCRWLRDVARVDAAIDYKAGPVGPALTEHCPDGIDVYFENVGGEILDAVLERINNYARIALCGLISQYNAAEPVPGPYNFYYVLIRRARVQGFIVLDYLDRAAEAEKQLVAWHREGRLDYRVDVVDGLENAPAALQRLFAGTNNGKLLVKVSDE